MLSEHSHGRPDSASPFPPPHPCPPPDFVIHASHRQSLPAGFPCPPCESPGWPLCQASVVYGHAGLRVGKSGVPVGRWPCLVTDAVRSTRDAIPRPLDPQASPCKGRCRVCVWVPGPVSTTASLCPSSPPPTPHGLHPVAPPPPPRRLHSPGQVCVVFICFPSMRLGGGNPAAIRECLLTWDVEPERTFAHQTPAGPAGPRCPLPGGTSCPADAQLGEAGAGGHSAVGSGRALCQLGNEVAHQPACLCLRLARLPGSTRCCFQMRFPGNWCGVFFPFSFFSFSVCLAEGHGCSCCSSGRETWIRACGRPSTAPPASLRSPALSVMRPQEPPGHSWASPRGPGHSD